MVLQQGRQAWHHPRLEDLGVTLGNKVNMNFTKM